MAHASLAQNILAKVGELLQSTLAQSESTLHELIQRMTEQVTEAKNHVSVCRDEEARLDLSVQAEERAAVAWEQRAMSAVRAGDDVTARDALLKKSRHEQQAEECRAELRRQKDELELLQQAVATLDLRIEQSKDESVTLLRRGQHKPLVKAVSDRRDEGGMPQRAGVLPQPGRAKR